MTIALSIIVALLVAWLIGSSCLRDMGDLLQGFGGILRFLGGHRGMRGSQRMLQEWQEDDRWIPSSVRFLFVVTMAVVAGYWTHRGLHALFGS
jgi:hypothetical protein